MPSGFQSQTYADTKDKDGFAEPVTPSDTMRLLTAYMRTDILSLAQVARRYAMNTNLIHRWLRDPRFAPDCSDTDVDVGEVALTS